MKEKEYKNMYKKINTEQLLKLMVANAKLVYSLSLQSTERSRKYFEIISKPKNGDYVMEVSALVLNFDKLDLINCVGILKEKISTSQFIIETLDGREFKWENSEFIKILQTPFRNIK